MDMDTLTRLCVNARVPSDLAEFHDKSQAHLIITDANSEKAAREMLKYFGSDVTEYQVAMGYHLFLWFADKAKADLAVSFYNRLPNKMTNFTVAKAAALLKRIGA